ncbi:prepilin-type N-terminal cleavage/methylation domain-containing protein [Gemmiger formicilis]|uniref:prepilin-type N-terminal cleavage/methylation domain-containing protein n=2 Tax=Gemmiger formicilis TaxID=745368 RepID=UPI001D0F1D94|nr:prepilin-type N-terminal cleavage/methylation domain-containing protein [Gemmiger formicilis]MCC2191823.1 prepilin-type N-terminal cleavage/methylation domain-containing protein [Gemmiger formicilis]
MVQYNKNIKNNKKGFTLVELMVVLAITAILAALVGGGLIAYTRLARFEKNEANARTLFQTAQISLTRMETAGELDAFRRQVIEEGSTGDHFQNDVTVTDAGGNTLVSRTKTELDQNVAALYYDRTGAAAGNHNALVERLLGDYIYDASLLNASICVEIDVQSGQVYSVFYDTKSDKLRFNQDGATNIYDRSYDHRRNDSLVGYYSAEDRVNVVQLVQTKLKVKNPRLTNGETLTLSWSGNSSLGDLDTSYTATAYDAKDTGKTKPLFTITIKRDTAGAADDNKQVITKMPVTIYTYNDAGQQTETKKELYFPLSYNKGSFVLTLDAMADAALLRACENSANVAATSLYSITRLLNDPQDIYIAMRAEPRENYSDTYTASKEETTNEENTLLAKGGTADKADLKYFRHLYNLRWSADWKIADKGTYTLTPQASNSIGLNWTGGGVTVYCAAGAWPPVAKVPSLNDPVAWPTIPELGENIVLTSKKAGITTQTTRVPILNLQLSSKSVAKTGRAEQDVLADHYVGLIGENKGKISYITLRDPDIQVNVKTETVAAGTLPNENQLKLTATKFVTALEDTDENWRDVRAVGALCGVNTGTLENCALTRGTNSSTSALVAAALVFDNTTTATDRKAQTLEADSKSYTYYTDEPRGIGGLVGVAIPKADSVMQDLTVASDVTVAGLLVDENTKNVTDTAADQQAEKARYAAAAAGPNDENSLWRSVGVGGVFGTVDAAQMTTNGNTNIVNNGFVTGNGFTGGIVGNLFTTGANTSTPLVLTGLRNNGTVSAGANYKGDTAGDARSLVLGQFFGGIAGYGRGVTLQGCESVTRSDLTETQLKEQVKAGFDETGTLTDASPLKGDFVGGLVGYGKEIVLNGCKTGKGYVLGSRFVGGLAGGFTGSGVQQNDTNSSDVFGSRYVGGIVSVNGSNSQISGMTNTGLVAAFGKNAAYVGGIVGVNDADWGGSQDKTATATVQNCANRMSGDNATDTRRINLLKELSISAGGYADYVGGIAGCNGKNGVVTWDKSGTPTLGAILYGNNYVGGVAGYNDENATISNTSGQKLSISGQIVAAGKAVGGMIGLNCAPKLPSATVKVSRVAGQQLVGGVIGANLPVGGFTVAGGAFNTDVASGRVEADAVAGGIIGYNRLLAAKPTGGTLEALLPTIDESTGVLTDSPAVKTADYEVILANFQNELNLQADIYVGGIVGANDADTKLTIQNATNGATENALSVGGLNPSNNGAFKGGVSLNALADGRYNFDNARGALAGGIIGYATPNTTLENCTNYGTVAHKCAAGGFAGWNEGTITGGSMAASLGNRETGYTYLGGVAGVNGGLIQSAYLVKDCAVRGDSYVGGIAGVNLGGNAAASKGLIICTENNSTGTVEANQYAGGVAGANVGSISLSGQLQSSVTATDYAGGVAGINTDKGSIYSADNANGAVLGSVTAANYAGGVAGTNRAEITRVENRASVRASTKYAGGIAGENAAGGKISACVHAKNQVYATNGEAGGIAGNNNKDALIENVQVKAAVTAANGTAGGVTATNFGIIGQGSGLESNSSVSNCTITGTSESIGAIAAYNGKDATIRNVRLAANANVRFSTPAVTIGGLAGMNEGTITGCQVENGALALDDSLRAGTNTVTLGGAVGRTTEHGTVSSTNVLLDLTQNLDKYTNLGGVAGQNDGTLDQCTYSGTMGGNADTDGLVSVGARSTGSTVGGIAGLNNSTITGCEVKYIKLQVSGISNITTTQTADEKLASASHVGGIAGRNNDEIVNSYVATVRSNGAGSIITARYGFVGGVAGSNNGTITGSGSKKALVSDDTTKLALVAQVKNWLGAADANTGINSMAAELTTGTTYANLMGVDTVSKEGFGYRNVYSQSGLAANDLLVALRGSNNSETVRAAGYLGGLAGFNSLRGTIDTSATGQWFVYSDNATTASTVGGIVGQNESNVTDKSVLDTVVNCAAVRRFTRVFKTGGGYWNQNKDDTDNENIYKGGSRVVVHVGGVIGQQQNRSDDRWSVSKVVNCGSVFNSRSANVGGVIAYWLDYGGTVQKCFNFGKMTTNTNDHDQQLGGYGAVGGVVGIIDQPISGGTTNVLSCRNYGQIWYDSNAAGANDCAGIIGKIEMKKPTDIMTLNIIDCVNSGAIKAESQAVGILAWIGPWKNGTIDNVTVNIDRCRNLNTNFTCEGSYNRKIGIVGSRGNGSGSKEATNVTNCFATVDTGWYPIAYVLYPGENVTGHGNYYIDYIENSDDSDGEVNSFFKKNERKLTTTKPAKKTRNWISPNHDPAYNETAWNPSSEKVKAHRLYIGYNVDSKADPYIAFLPTLAKDGNGAAYSLWWMRGITSTDWNAAKNSAYIKKDGNKAYIFDDTGAGYNENPGQKRADVMLQFGEAANSTNDSDVDITDITDEVIQNYYKYVLDSTKPAKPEKIDVKASQVQDADNNVYGRYKVTWDEPKDKEASPAAYYRVEILPCDAKGTVAAGAVPYLKADVYQRSYTFVADKAWTGNFVVRVTPYNTNDDPKQPDNPNTSGVQTFMHALPTPELEVRLVKRSEFNWNECKKADGNEEFKYEQILVLKNYEDYPKNEDWTVTVTRNDVKNPYTFSRQEGKKYIRIALNIGVTKTFTALATPAAGSTSYLRSAEYKVETYVPSQRRDVNYDSNKKNEDGLPVGMLSKAENAKEYVTYSGQSAENFAATVTFGFTPTSADPTHGNPTYRVMLLAKYLGDDTVNGQSLYGQYITLAAREGIVTETPVTFNLNSLPSDAMSNYTDFLVIAVPITSGKGDVTTRWDATPDEVSAAIASHANDTSKEIWWKNGYEIVRTGEHSYTYAHLTPLCFSDVNRTDGIDDREWAIQATQTTPQIIFKQLNLNVLKAPTLAETIEDGVVDNNNQLTYTFNWTQEDMDAKTPTYSIKLYGLLTDENGNVTGQEQIALKDGVNLADKVQNSGNSFTLPVNVDTMLANGSDSWRYDKVRLEVTRVAAADTDEIGASAVADYSVKQRLPGISAPSSITRVNGETDNADALLYTVSWSPSADARIDHYDLCAVDASGKTVLTLRTADNIGSLMLDLEQYQGKALSFRVIARRKDDTCFDGPDGALSQSETIVRRADAPTVTASSFAPASPNQETFLNDLKLNMTLGAAAQGNVYFTGYIFSNEDNYNTIADLARTWQGEGAGQAKYEAQQELTKALDEMLANRDAELVIPKDSRTVGGSASVNDNTASYTFVPDGNGFTLTPDHAKQYLLPAVRVMPTDGRTASNWFYILQDAAKAQLPAITLDAPVDAAEPERALGNAVYKQEVNLYNDPEFAVERGKAPLELRRFTVEWTAVNKYTQADGTVRNLTDRYSFTVTPLGKDKKPYIITVTTYDRDETDTDGTTHKRGEIKTVTKTYNDKTTEIAKQTTVVDAETKETRIWYDLSVEPVTDENGNVTWEPKPYDVTGTVEKDGGTLYYKAKTVPMLELVQEDGAEPVYRITLPELQEKVQDDSLDLQKFTASVTLQTLAHSDNKGKTVESGTVKVPVNEANTADAAEDAQSMDSTESVAPAETAESTAAESAPASVPPVLMRARAALPMATPETAAAPDETDAAETAPPERTETSDAS